jgi:electron transfer flavoprotein-quinone oxidoreductase
MMQREYDVVVIGAGFGGPVAAKKCADASLKTLMLERSENPGEKVISGLTIPIYGFLFGPAFIRDGNPPIERPVDGIRNYVIYDIKSGDIEIVELRIPGPLSPIIAFGYNAYCMPFCSWEAEQAVRAGAELLTSTTVVDFIKNNGHIEGIVTEKGEEVRSKIVINCEGSQGLLAIKAGIRNKYPPRVISLADTYDYECSKEVIDRVFGHTLRFCWGFDEQKIAPPLGHGNGLMAWPYKSSIHWMQDQCLALDDGQVPNLRRLFDEYHENITTQLPWWRDEIAHDARLRARMWEGFGIYVGLDDELRNLPSYTDGMILAGDVAGLESTGLCDGVPTAWFSADIAADTAIEAIKANDFSATFLQRYDHRIRTHSIIQWAITCNGRWNLRKAQESHDRKDLKARINYQFGPGILTHAGTPLVGNLLQAIRKDPLVLKKWARMFLRYYYNWENDGANPDMLRGERNKKRALDIDLFILDALVVLLSPVSWILACLLTPLSGAINPLIKLLLPAVELALRAGIKAEPLFNPLSRWMIEYVKQADPAALISGSSERSREQLRKSRASLS